jgi:4-amino-4-deoxy-L-arabinose transferase-like glycosyltransferase
VDYLSTADNVAQGKGYVNYLQQPYVMWPPAYPTLMAVLRVAGVPVLEAGRYINALAFGLVTALAGLWAMLRTRSVLAGAIVSGLVLLSDELLLISSYVWTEPLFTAWLMVFVFAAGKLLDSTSLKWALLAGVAAALGCLTRYPGVALIGVGVLLLCPNRQVGLGRRLLQAACFVGVAALPLALWLARNVSVSGTMTGKRAAAAVSVWENAASAGQAFFFWGVPSWRLVVTVPGLLTATVFVLLLAAVFWTGVVRPLRHRPSAPRWAIVPALVVICYLGMLVATASAYGMDTVDPRLIAPVFPCVVLWGLAVVWGFSQAQGPAGVAPTGSRPSRRARTVITVGLAVVFLAQGAQSAWFIYRYLRYGREYTSSYWRQSPAIQFLDQTRPRQPILSNVPDAIWFRTGLAARFSPSKYAYRSNVYVGAEELAALKDSLTAHGSEYLVWFAPFGRKYLFEPDELRQHFTVEVERQFPGGVLYRISLPPASAP